MTLAGEQGRDLRRVIMFAAIGAAAGVVYSALGHGPLWLSAASGACDGAALSGLEIFLLRRWAFTHLPFAAYFALRLALYSAVLLLGGPSDWFSGTISAVQWRDVEFYFAVCVVVNLLLSVNQLLGQGVLFAFAAGRYRRPRREERVLLYIDLCGSTALAERLGEERFLDLLNAFYADVTAEIVAEGGEIHKYVGDEVIAVWRAGTAPERPIRACFAARRRLARRAQNYRAEFGAAPDFRAAIHAGPVVIGELGSAKKEIALIGDAMNTAARILETARETGASVLISAAYFKRIAQTPSGLCVRRLEPTALRGKLAPLSLISLIAERQRLVGG